ncbi:MAG: class I SAM-dependent methyltransferase [Acidobacteria bacterium]|nr:class I SAM-dependent methyltransferase [Acidobacteriota bacterium]
MRGEVIVESWRRNAELWTRAVREQAIASRAAVTDEAVVRAVLRHQPARVLDCGCGEGWLSHRLAREGVQPVGFDVSPDLVAAARQGPGVFHVLSFAEFEEDPARLGVFDLAAVNFSLFEEDLGSFLQAIARVLAPGGRLVIQTLHPAGGPVGWREESFAALGGLGAWTPMPWFARTVDDWRAALRDAGFGAVEIEEPGPGPSSLLMTAALA